MIKYWCNISVHPPLLTDHWTCPWSPGAVSCLHWCQVCQWCWCSPGLDWFLCPAPHVWTRGVDWARAQHFRCCGSCSETQLSFYAVFVVAGICCWDCSLPSDHENLGTTCVGIFRCIHTSINWYLLKLFFSFWPSCGSGGTSRSCGSGCCCCDLLYLDDKEIVWGWGDSEGEDGDDSEESDWTGIIFFLTLLCCSLFSIITWL